MTPEDRFVKTLAQVESSGKETAWGDAGRACGRFQWHPSAYLKWEDTAEEYGGEERTWDWAFEQAVRKFYRAAQAQKTGRSDLQIAMAYHLHGELRYEGWDVGYEESWNEQRKILGL